MENYIIGVDGGKTGGICILSEDGSIAHVCEMPMFSGKKPQYDKRAIADLLSSFPPRLVVLEGILIKGPLTSKQAAQSTGWCLGFFEGMCTGLNLRCEVVPPKTWQDSLFKGRSGEPKMLSAMIASGLAPEQDWRHGPKKKATGIKDVHDGMTDAFCLAEYGRRNLL